MSGPTINLPELQRLTKELETARSHRALAQQLVDALAMRHVHISVSALVTVTNEEDSHRRSDSRAQGYNVPLVELLPYSNGKVRAVDANRQVLAAMQRHAQERLIGWNGKVEGLEFQIRNLVRGA